MRGTPETKVCTGCKNRLPLDAFGEERRVKDGRKAKCEACEKASSRAYFETNRDRELARCKVRYAANLERERAKQRSYREAHREYFRARSRTHREENREHMKAQNRAWKAANPDKVSATNRAWKRANPGKVRASDQRRRGGWVYSDNHIEQEIFDRCGGCCSYCAKAQSRNLRGPWTEAQCWQADHVIGRAHAGNNVLGNVVVACSACHRLKHSSPQELLPIVIELRPPTRRLTVERTLAPDLPLAADGHTLQDLLGSAQVLV